VDGLHLALLILIICLSPCPTIAPQARSSKCSSFATDSSKPASGSVSHEAAPAAKSQQQQQQ